MFIFVTHVVTSTGTDTYSTMAAALASLKGPRHGGATIKLLKCLICRENINDWNDDQEIEDYLNKNT